MVKINVKISAILLIFALIFSQISLVAVAADKTALDNAVNKAAAYMYKTVTKPEIGSVGGEWAVIGLARSSYSVPDLYYSAYYAAVEKYVKNCKGVLHDVKYTEYSRVILGLTAAGYDPRNVGGYDLTVALGDFDKTVYQGINGAIFALISLDCMNYAVPKNSAAKTQAMRDMYISEILRRQLNDGGWNLTAGADGKKVNASEKSDPDITGMALQALAKYQDKSEVKNATDKALKYLSSAQDKNGGYASSEGTVQAIVALCELGVDINDARFVKNGKSLVDNLLSFQSSDGSFKHDSTGSGNSQMSTEQALYGLVAAQRLRDGKNSLYRMNDTVKRGNFLPVEEATPTGLPNKHKDVKSVAVVGKKTFADIKGHANQTAIEALAERGIIDGSDGKFNPDKAMTRAEFASVITRGLGLPAVQSGGTFNDIPSGAWYAGAVETAYYYGIITGVSEVKFNPTGTITRQEAAVMIARAAKLCGLDITLTSAEIRDMLAQFGDYKTAANWAQPSLAFCYKENILSQDDLNIRPSEAVKRCEIAEMLYRLLKSAKLL